jgi:hypothetical protein
MAPGGGDARLRPRRQVAAGPHLGRRNRGRVAQLDELFHAVNATGAYSVNPTCDAKKILGAALLC